MLNSLNLSSKSDCFSLERDNLLYLSGFDGVISSRTIERFYSMFIVIVLKPNGLLDVNNNDYVVNINDLIIYTANYNICISYNSQVLVIDQLFFKNISIPKFSIGLIEHIHGSLIRRLFEAIKYSENPIYEILALANIIGVNNYKTNMDNQLIKVKGIIEDNSNSEQFDLAKLCGLAYMSKRKVQYILSDANTTFLELLNNYRIEGLKELLLKEPKTSTDILITKVGFNNQNTANRIFKRKFGVSISGFKRDLRSINN